MIIKNREIWLHWKPDKSFYTKVNRKEITEAPRVIGTTITAVNKMVASFDEQNELMRDILGLSSIDPNWGARLKNYWHSFSESVSPAGRKLEIGFEYDISNPSKLKYIEAINSILSKSNTLTTDADLVKFFQTKHDAAMKGFQRSMVEAKKLTNASDRDKHETEAYHVKHTALIQAEQEQYKLGNPINTLEYMIYRFCLHLGTVANEFALVNKSPKIKLYLHSKEEEDRFKELKMQAEALRMETFLSVVKKPEYVDDLLYAMDNASVVVGGKPIDKHLALEKLSTSRTKEFVDMANHKDLSVIALVKKYISFDIFHQLEGSSIVVNAIDNADVIGNNVGETITYFNNNKNESRIKEFKTRFNSLPK